MEAKDGFSPRSPSQKAEWIWAGDEKSACFSADQAPRVPPPKRKRGAFQKDCPQFGIVIQGRRKLRPCTLCLIEPPSPFIRRWRREIPPLPQPQSFPLSYFLGEEK